MEVPDAKKPIRNPEEKRCREEWCGYRWGEHKTDNDTVKPDAKAILSGCDKSGLDYYCQKKDQYRRRNQLSEGKAKVHDQEEVCHSKRDNPNREERFLLWPVQFSWPCEEQTTTDAEDKGG